MEKGNLGKTKSVGFNQLLKVDELVKVESINEEMKLVQVSSVETKNVDVIPFNKFKLTPMEKQIQTAMEGIKEDIPENYTIDDLKISFAGILIDIMTDKELSNGKKVNEAESYIQAMTRLAEKITRKTVLSDPKNDLVPTTPAEQLAKLAKNEDVKGE